VILPTAYLPALLLMVLAMIALGSWANTLKMGKWRFELFYYDYSIGVLLCALLAALTLGSLVPQELTFQDNLLIASKRQMLYAVFAGVVFNLANILLVAAIAVSGMSVAFPICFGLALAIGVVSSFIPGSQANPFLLFGGALLGVIAAALAGFAYGEYRHAQYLAARAVPQAGVRLKPPGPPPSAARGIVLGVVAGILMGLYSPLIEISREGDGGVAPYGIALLFAAGVLVSTLLYVPFFSNFPVQGKPIEISAYFKGNKKQHLLGLLGGILSMTAMISSLAASSAPPVAQTGSAGAILGQGAPVLGAVWGLLAWREFKGANSRVVLLLAIMIVLFVAGVVLISVR
jgi:glucose uptake protein